GRGARARPAPPRHDPPRLRPRRLLLQVPDRGEGLAQAPRALPRRARRLPRRLRRARDGARLELAREDRGARGATERVLLPLQGPPDEPEESMRAISLFKEGIELT